ncbi:hypothetical protein NMY22_g10870 [Coprinellus aureogranulatus]|nr:hypothetical protein NMY22_g10870 [Coprinellus aureogranulatus]
MASSSSGDSSSSDSNSDSGSGTSSDSSSSSDEDSNDEESGEDADPADPLTSFFNSLRHGQTISMDSSDDDSSDEEESEGGVEGEESDGDGKGGRKERVVRPLPKRARPVIEVIGEGEGNVSKDDVQKAS